MFDAMKNKVIDAAQVTEKFGVPPEKVLEVLSLIGVSSDNVPGVAGIGQDGGPCLEAVTIMDVNGAVVGCVTFPDQDLGQVTIEWQEHNGKAVPA